MTPASGGIGKLTVKAIREYEKSDVRIAGFVKRLMVESYQDFLDALFDDLATAMSDIERDPGDDEPEDTTTRRLLATLKGMGYTAYHDCQAGGHVDITIELVRKQFSWIAEAKKFGSVSDLTQGYLQLSTRYRPQLVDGNLQGGLIGYLRRPQAVTHVQSWRDHFSTLPVAAGSTFDECLRRRSLAFYSTHEHQDYGLPFRVWHTCITMNRAPKDGSGEKAAKYRSNHRA